MSEHKYMTHCIKYNRDDHNGSQEKNHSVGLDLVLVYNKNPTSKAKSFSIFFA